MAIGTEVIETVAPDENVDPLQARKASAARVDGILGKIQMGVGMGIFGLVMLELGGYMGIQMSFGYTLNL